MALVRLSNKKEKNATERDVMMDCLTVMPPAGGDVAVLLCVAIMKTARN